MKRYFASLLKIRPGEHRLVWLLVGMMLLTAAGSAVGGASIDALFFARYGVQSLPAWYIVLGIVNFLNLMLIAGIAGRTSRGRLYQLLPVILAATMLAARLLLIPNLRWVYPALYVGKEVVNALQGVFLWGLASSLLDARQSKRLFPLLTAGGIAGSMIGSFGMPLFVKASGAEAMLVVWSLTLGITAWLCYRLIQPNRQRLQAKAPGSSETSGIASLLDEIRDGYRFVRRSSLLRWFSLASLLFSVLWFALLLPFSRLSASQYPDADQLASFFGLFQGAWTAAALLISLLATSRLFSRIGVINSLVIYPLIYLVGFGILSVYTSFALIVSIRFIQIIWSQSLAETAWQTSFNAIPGERRDQARAFINAVPGQAGIVLSGLILIIGEQTLPPQQLYWIGLGVAAVCTWVLLRSKRGYVQALGDALASGQPNVFYNEDEPFGGVQNDPAALAVLQSGLADPDPGRRRLSAEIMGDLPAKLVAQNLVDCLDDPEPEVRTACLAALASTWGKQPAHGEFLLDERLASRAAACLADPNPEVRQQAIRTLLVLHPDDSDFPPKIEPLLADAVPGVQIQAARALVEVESQPAGSVPLESHPMAVLTGLASNSELEVRQEALAALGEMLTSSSTQPDEVWEILQAGLDDPQPAIRQAVLDGLVHPPVEICPSLVAALQDEDPMVRTSAVSSLVRLGSAGLPELWGALDDPAKEEGALDVLSALAPQLVPATLHPVLEQYLRRKVSAALEDHVLWHDCLAAGSERIDLLLEALRHRSQELAVLGLKAFGIANPQVPVELAIRSIRSGDSFQKAYALETLEASSGSQEIRSLLVLWETGESSAPCESPILAALQDPDPWLRACAAFAANESPDPEIDARLAELAEYDPDELVRATAGANGDNPMETLQTLSTMERILFLRKVPLFAGLPPQDLKHVAGIATERYYLDGALISRQGEPGDMLFIIASGQVRVTSSGIELALRQVGDFVGEMAVISQAPRMASLSAVGSVRLLCVGQKDFEAVLRQRPEVGLAVMRVLSSRLSEQAALLSG